MFFCIFLFKQNTADELRISYWSSDVCSSDLVDGGVQAGTETDVDEKVAHAFDGQSHQVVYAQARQGVQQLAAPVCADGHEARIASVAIGVGAVAQTPKRGLGFQSRAAAGRAGRVAAVLR